MNSRSKNISIILLGLGSLICSRFIFTLIDDPEGPNLLIVVVLATAIFAVVLGIARFLVNRF